MAQGRTIAIYFNEDDLRRWHVLKGFLAGHAERVGEAPPSASRVFGVALQAACMALLPDEMRPPIGLPTNAELDEYMAA